MGSVSGYTTAGTSTNTYIYNRGLSATEFTFTGLSIAGITAGSSALFGLKNNVFTLNGAASMGLSKVITFSYGGTSIAYTLTNPDSIVDMAPNFYANSASNALDFKPAYKDAGYSGTSSTTADGTIIYTYTQNPATSGVGFTVSGLRSNLYVDGASYSITTDNTVYLQTSPLQPIGSYSNGTAEQLRSAHCTRRFSWRRICRIDRHERQ